MSESSESKGIFTKCKQYWKFFCEIDKSTPIYHQTGTDIQKNYLDAWKNVINSSIALQQEFVAKYECQY